MTTDQLSAAWAVTVLGGTGCTGTALAAAAGAVVSELEAPTRHRAVFSVTA